MTETAEAPAEAGSLTQVNTAVAAFDKVAAGISELRSKHEGCLYDVATAKGMKEACAARAEVREVRYELERVRKTVKAPLLELGREIDARAASIKEQLVAIERPIDEQIGAEERRKEAEKEAKVKAELARVAAIHERIAVLRGNQLLTPSDGALLIGEHIADLQGITVDASFAEFESLAAATKASTIERLGKLLSAAQTHEAEQARLAAEREQLARERAEQAERNRVERERIAAEEAAAKAKRDAEAAAHVAELERQRAAIKAQEDAAAAERQRLADEQAAKLRAEREESERLAREQQAKLDEQRRQQEAEAARLAEQQAELERQQKLLETTSVTVSLPANADPSDTGGTVVSSALVEVPKLHVDTEAGTATYSDSFGSHTVQLAPSLPPTKEWQPSAEMLIGVIAADFGVSSDTAGRWLRDAFAPVPLA